MTGGVTFTIIFAVLLLWSYYKGSKPGLLALWAVMFGIAIGGTQIGSTAYAAVTNILGAAGSAVVAAFNGAVG